MNTALLAILLIVVLLIILPVLFASGFTVGW